MLKSDILDHHFIIEIINAKFFKNIFLLKLENITDILTQNIYDTMCENLRSKQQRKETSFRDDFYTYLVRNYSITCQMHHFGKMLLNLKLNQLENAILGFE